jgi:imidazole glycerol-phosphate synthase subunit HisH
MRSPDGRDPAFDQGQPVRKCAFMETVVILDYGMSNLRSVAKALEFISSGKQHVLVSGSVADLKRADRLVFPGQGAIGD